MVNRRRPRFSFQHVLPSSVLSQLRLLWVRQCSELQPLSPGVAREICSVLRAVLIPTVADGHRLQCFSPVTKKWTAWAIPGYPVTVPDGRPSTVAIGHNEVVVCGGRTKSGKCYLVLKTAVLVSSAKCTALPFMYRPRFAHGILYVEEQLAVYVFGGYQSLALRPFKYVEKLSLTTLRWKCMGRMCEPRQYFNPCRHGDLAYLCSGKQRATCETMNLQTREYTLIMEIPLQDSQVFFCAVYAEQLVIVCSKEVRKYDLKTKAEVGKHCADEVYAYMLVDTPVVYAGLVYGYSDQDARGVRLDLRSGEQVIYTSGKAVSVV